MKRKDEERIETILAQAIRDLQLTACDSESQIKDISCGFQELAKLTQTLLLLASETVDSLESENVRSVFPKVLDLGLTARSFFERKINATTGIVSAVERENKLLHQFSLVTRRQGKIALKTSVLTMFTNIEVGRLGSDGSGFQHLAATLAEFSNTLTQDTEDLARHIEERIPAIESTRRVLSAQIPNLRSDFARIDVSVGDDMASLETGLTRLSEAPVSLRVSLEDIAQQISQIVCALQSQDITRQQLEHVHDALSLISSRVSKTNNVSANNFGEAYAGLKIQSYQLRNIKATTLIWTTQIRSCMEIILKVSASEVAGIGPFVNAQEQEIASKLLHIEELEKEGQGYSKNIRETFSSRSALLQFVGEHSTKSKIVRHQLLLLSLNSIIEANRLGSQADAVFEIAKSISDISADWGAVAEQSSNTAQEIMDLVEQTGDMMKVFSELGDERFHEAQSHTRSCLEELRGTASLAIKQADDMQSVMKKMHALIADIGGSRDQLDSTYRHLDNVLDFIEDLKSRLEQDKPEVKCGFDPEEMQKLFSSSYTTESEREISYAALLGQPLPEVQTSIPGNNIELF